MSDVARHEKGMLQTLADRAAATVAPRNIRISIAVLLGGLTIAASHWVAITQPPGASTFGLGMQSASGMLLIPAYGGFVTGLVTGFSRRPVYADAAAGTYAAFVGLAMLMVWVGIARITGDLPADSGFHRMGPISGAMFVLVIGFVNAFISFPVNFVIMFTSRSFIPNNRNNYGWLVDDDLLPGLDYVTPGPNISQGDLRSTSTAHSRFRPGPVRYSSIPKRFLDPDSE